MSARSLVGIVRNVRIAVAAWCCAWLVGQAQADCFADKAQKWQVSEHFLRMMCDAESNGNPRAVHKNSDGTIDRGLCQINSSLPALRQRNITADDLLNKPCLTVDLYAEVMHDMIREYGPTWRAVGGVCAGMRKDREKARQSCANYMASRYATFDHKAARHRSKAASGSAARIELVAQAEPPVLRQPRPKEW